MDLHEKIIVITGASKGLGRAMAIHFAQKGAEVILVARTEILLQQVQEDIKKTTGSTPTVISCDISSEKNVQLMAEAIREKYRTVDILINNAGFGTFQTSENLSNQEMRRHFEVNFFGAYYCVKALLPLLKQSNSGYILNIGSLFSKVALAQNSVYAATKFALAGFSEGLRRELKPSKIDVGLFLPGPIKTSFHKDKGKEAVKTPQSLMLDSPEAARKIVKMIQRRKKQMTVPNWMMLALKLRYL